MLRCMPRSAQFILFLVILLAYAPIYPSNSATSVLRLYTDGAIGTWYESLLIPASSILLLIILSTVIQASSRAKAEEAVFVRDDVRK